MHAMQGGWVFTDIESTVRAHKGIMYMMLVGHYRPLGMWIQELGIVTCSGRAHVTCRGCFCMDSTHLVSKGCVSKRFIMRIACSWSGKLYSSTFSCSLKLDELVAGQSKR